MNIRVTFVSNYLTIHQISLCKEFFKRLGDNFKFVSSFEPTGEKRKYANYENEPFVIHPFLSKRDRKKAVEIINKSDIVIFGSGDRSLLKNNKKVIFFYMEHLSKTKINFLRKIHLQMLYKKFTNAYLLCASCYSQVDFNSIGLFVDKCFYFGYFPLLVEHDLKQRETEHVNLMWVGRELKLKRPEYAFYAAKILYDEKIKCNVKIVSTRNNIIKELIEMYKTKPWFNNIELISPTDNFSIQKMMFQSDIFILSSDENEGWGAVVNEAMNAGCCPIVSSSTGCSHFLIEDGFNGYIFDNYEEFETKLLTSINNLEFKEMGRNAFETIQKKWNAANAVTNLLSIFELVINKKEIPLNLINNGPGTKIL